MICELNDRWNKTDNCELFKKSEIIPRNSYGNHKPTDVAKSELRKILLLIRNKRHLITTDSQLGHNTNSSIV